MSLYHLDRILLSYLGAQIGLQAIKSPTTAVLYFQKKSTSKPFKDSLRPSNQTPLTLRKYSIHSASMSIMILSPKESNIKGKLKTSFSIH